MQYEIKPYEEWQTLIIKGPVIQKTFYNDHGALITVDFHTGATICGTADYRREMEKKWHEGLLP